MIFQWIVDASQKQPHWWARQCVIASVITMLIGFMLKGHPLTAWRAVGTAIILGIYWANFICTASAERCSRTLALPVWMRLFFWLWCAVSVLGNITDLKPDVVAGEVSFLFYASIFSFAACRPPAPPKRREQLAMGGAS